MVFLFRKVRFCSTWKGYSSKYIYAESGVMERLHCGDFPLNQMALCACATLQEQWTKFSKLRAGNGHQGFRAQALIQDVDQKAGHNHAWGLTLALNIPSHKSIASDKQKRVWSASVVWSFEHVRRCSGSLGEARSVVLSWGEKSRCFGWNKSEVWRNRKNHAWFTGSPFGAALRCFGFGWRNPEESVLSVRSPPWVQRSPWPNLDIYEDHLNNVEDYPFCSLLKILHKEHDAKIIAATLVEWGCLSLPPAHLVVVLVFSPVTWVNNRGYCFLMEDFKAEKFIVM